jgi:hypothetical protein
MQEMRWGVTRDVGCEVDVTRTDWVCASQTWVLLGTLTGLVGRDGARLLLLLLCVETRLPASCLQQDVSSRYGSAQYQASSDQSTMQPKIP